MLPSTVLVPVTKYTVRGKRFFTQKPRSREGKERAAGPHARLASAAAQSAWPHALARVAKRQPAQSWDVHVGLQLILILGGAPSLKFGRGLYALPEVHECSADP